MPRRAARRGLRNSLGLFVSGHGLGHAARAAALVEALWRRQPALRFHWFGPPVAGLIAASTRAPVQIEPVPVDIGLVQPDALTIDHAETLRRLAAAIPPRRDVVTGLACRVRDLGCTAVICDIAPLGLAVAASAGVPGILVENFTWDWIYAPYCGRFPGYRTAVEWVAEQVESAALHVQCEPVCRPHPAALRVPPMARALQAPEQIRERLGLGDEQPLVLVSMGGIPFELRLPEALCGHRARFLVLTDTPESGALPDSVLRLPTGSRWYHPDLVAAADLIIGKLGYSTVAEALAAGTAYGYVERPDFAESAVLGDFVADHVAARAIPAAAFQAGEWLEALGPMIVRRRVRDCVGGGAEVAAAAILDHIGGGRVTLSATAISLAAAMALRTL